jgi:hypothetical protein
MKITHKEIITINIWSSTILTINGMVNFFCVKKLDHAWKGKNPY